MRLIDANAYLKKVCTYNKTGCGSCRLQDKCPVNEPTVDAVPVRHGKWMVTPVYIKCSECGESFMLIPQNYCPNCGARMIKGEKDGI